MEDKAKEEKLRDQFAGQAMMGLVAKYNLNKPEDQDTMAQMAYELADAMMLRRMYRTRG